MQSSPRDEELGTWIYSPAKMFYCEALWILIRRVSCYFNLRVRFFGLGLDPAVALQSVLHFICRKNISVVAVFDLRQHAWRKQAIPSQCCFFVNERDWVTTTKSRTQRRYVICACNSHLFPPKQKKVFFISWISSGGPPPVRNLVKLQVTCEFVPGRVQLVLCPDQSPLVHVRCHCSPVRLHFRMARVSVRLTRLAPWSGGSLHPMTIQKQTMTNISLTLGPARTGLAILQISIFSCKKQTSALCKRQQNISVW